VVQDDKVINVAPLAALLRGCVVDARFNDTQRALLHQWMEVIEHPRRKRRAVDKFTMSHHAQRHVVAPSCCRPANTAAGSVRRVKSMTADELTRKKHRPVPEVSKWNRTRRKRFVEGVLMCARSSLCNARARGTDRLLGGRYGFARLPAVRTHVYSADPEGAPELTDDDMRDYAVDFLQLCKCVSVACAGRAAALT
jgi:hypothetical protein